MALSTIPDAAVGSVAAALIAAFIGFVGLVISKENKTSEFRHAWIDALRADIGVMIANANAIRGAMVAEHASKQDLFSETKDLFVTINQAATSIRLRLNPKERECQVILEKIAEYEKFMDRSPIDISACQECEKALIASAQVFLKKEWLRVRDGEPIFTFAKWIGFIAASVMLTWLAFTWANSPAAPPSPTGKNQQNPVTSAPATAAPPRAFGAPHP
jgi:hypothetical protein